MSLKTLEENRGSLAKPADAILKPSRDESRALTVDEASAYDAIADQPPFPRLRSSHQLIQRPSPQKQFPSNKFVMKTLMHMASVVVVILTAFASQGAIVQYSASLNGPSESPPNQSPATGIATFDFDTITHSLSMSISFSNLVGTTTVAHIHADTAVAGTGTAGVASGLTSWTTGLQSGTYTNTINMLSSASYSSAYLAAHGGTAASAETDLLAAMASGKAYLNLHSTTYPGGEIRGFITTSVPVPEPGTFLPAAALVAGALLRRRRGRGHRSGGAVA